MVSNPNWINPVGFICFDVFAIERKNDIYG